MSEQDFKIDSTLVVTNGLTVTGGTVDFSGAASGGGIELTDLSASTAAAGTAALAFDNTTGAFTLTPPDLSTYLTGITGESLADLSNVNNTAATDGQVLTWDNANSYWKPATAAGGGGGETYFATSSSTTTAPAATGTETLTIGATSTNAADYNVTIGYGASSAAGGDNGVAIGRIAESDAQQAIGIGYWARGHHNNSIALGTSAVTTAANQLMLGSTSSYGGALTSIRVGNANYTPSDNMDLATKAYVDANGGGGGGGEDYFVTGSSLSTLPTATGARSIAIGHASTTGSSTYSFAAGSSARADGGYAVAIGEDADAHGSSSIAIGKANLAEATNSIAIGRTAEARGDDSVAIGYFSDTTAAGDYSVCIGSYAINHSSNSVSIGHWAETSAYGVAIGGGTSTSSHANAASSSVAVGMQAFAGSNSFATALGRQSYASGSNSTALGYNAIANSGNMLTLGNTSVNNLKCQDTSISSVSDRRDKTQIEDLTIGLSFVNAITPKAFYKNNRAHYYSPVYTDEQLEADETLVQSYTFDQAAYDAATEKYTQREFGFVSQDVAAQLPATYSDARVSYSEDDPLHGYNVQHFTMGDMTPILWKALRELSDKHDQLQSDYDALLARVVALENA